MPGNISGFLSINDNGGRSPQIVQLSGVATLVSISPTSLAFGAQKVGTSSGPLVAAVTNTGSVVLNFSSITLVGSNASDFFQVNACGRQLQPGTSCQISVTFTPLAIGKRTASVRIGDNGGGSPQTITLIGTGT